MSRLKRSRALRRNLRKQARKGTLSARERKTLLQQEKRFRKARRPFMRGLGFGAGLGTGALLVPGVAGLISGLGGLRPGKEDPNEDPNEDPKNVGRGPDYADPEGMGATRATSGRGGRGEVDEFEDPEGMGATRATGPTENPFDEEGRNLNPNLDRGYDIPVQDVVVVGEEEEEEGEDAAEERQATPEDQARAERAAQRAERAREAGVDAALEAGLGGLDRPPVVVDDPTQPRERARLPEVSQGVEVDMTPAGQDAAQRAQSRAERAREAAIDAALEAGLGGSESVLPGTLSERNMLDYLDDYGRPGPGRMSPRPARPLPVDRPDPRMGSTLDPRLPVALGLEPMSDMDRVEMLRRRMAQGGRVDKSNDLVARIKRKYGLR